MSKPADDVVTCSENFHSGLSQSRCLAFFGSGSEGSASWVAGNTEGFDSKPLVIALRLTEKAC